MMLKWSSVVLTVALVVGPAATSSIHDAAFTSDPIEEDIMSIIDRCESGLTCAGVSLEPNGTVAKTKLYQHTFVGPYKTEKTYETRKPFTYHRGRIIGGKVFRVETALTVAEAKELCMSDVECVAFSYPVRSLIGLLHPPNITFFSTLQDFLPDDSDNWRTYVSNNFEKANNVNGEVLTYDERVVERPYRSCCNGTDVPSMKEVAAVDNLERISCDISREEFFLRYEAPRKPVMLLGCGKDWPAVVENKWLPENLIPRFGNDTRWRARIGGKKLLKNEEYSHNARWGDIVEAMLTNKPYYVFDKLYDPEAKSIDDDYEDPLPVKNGDLFSKLPYFDGPLRWFCIGPRNTGTMAHLDPYGTDAWNTLLKGHKWWIIYPKGFTDEDQLECEPSCSVKSPLTVHWYAGVGVNAARTEYPLDKYPRHILQHPGETIYIPDGLIHSVYNYDETIAITKNYASAANLDEVWMETVITGDPLKWKMMYYHTLNSEQRRRVRSSKYWPPTKWEQKEPQPQCYSDEDDLMEEYPMFEHAEDWEPKIGETVEALYRIASGWTDKWDIATVTNKVDGKYNVMYMNGEADMGLDIESLGRLPQVGEVIEAQYNAKFNEWYKATVTHAQKGRYDVKYDGEDDDYDLPRGSIREYYDPYLYEMMQAKWTDPDDGERLWVDCVIASINGDDTYNVMHYDGYIAENISADDLRRVKWEYKAGDDVIYEYIYENVEREWLFGRIKIARPNGRYDIALDDGDVEFCVRWRSIRFAWASDGYVEFDDEEDDER